MKVTVVLLGMHRALLPSGAESSGCVTMVFDEMGVPLSRVRQSLGMPASAPRIVFVNGQHIKDDTVIHDGETVTFVSPVAGG